MKEEGRGQIDTPENLPGRSPTLLGLKSIVHIVLVLIGASYTE